MPSARARRTRRSTPPVAACTRPIRRRRSSAATLQLADLSRALDGRGKRRASVLIVGEEAAGKSALALAWLAANPKREIWATSASELVAGASGLGEWQERVAAVLGAAETLDAVLYFDDFGALFADRPAEGGIELGAALRRHVADGRVRVIGELAPAALDRAERHDASLIGAMLRITVPPTEPETTRRAALAWAEFWRRTSPAGRRSRRGAVTDGRRPRATLPAVSRVPRQGDPFARGAARRARRRSRRRRPRQVARRQRAVRGVRVDERHPARAARRFATARDRRCDREPTPPDDRPGRRRAPRRRGDRASRRRACSPPTSHSRACCSSGRAASARPSSRARSPRTCSATPTSSCAST